MAVGKRKMYAHQTPSIGKNSLGDNTVMGEGSQTFSLRIPSLPAVTLAFLVHSKPDPCVIDMIAPLAMAMRAPAVTRAVGIHLWWYLAHSSPRVIFGCPTSAAETLETGGGRDLQQERTEGKEIHLCS